MHKHRIQVVAVFLAGVTLTNTGFAQKIEPEAASNYLVWMPRGTQKTTPSGLRSARNQARWFDSVPIASIKLTVAERKLLETELGPGHIFEDREYRTSLLPSTAITGIPAIWNAGFTGRGQAVAVIDTGINPLHPSFLGVNIVQRVFLNSGKDHPCFGDDAATGNDLQGHGTRTSSILASQPIPLFPGYFGAVRGVGTLFAMKAGFRARAGSPCPASDGVLLASDILAAMEFIANQTDAKVVNLSLGSNSDNDDDPLARIFDYFADRYGLTIVFAGGNRGTEAGIQTPGISYNGITVANVDDKGTEDKRDDTIHPSSTRGPTAGLRSKPDIAAPGTRIYAAEYNSNGFNLATGTSAAAPLVAGAATLLRDAGVENPLAVKAVLLNSTDGDGTWLRDWGWGNLNAAAAFDQRRNVLTGTVAPRASRYFRGSLDGPFRAMLVWNRHPDVSAPNAPSPLFELALTVFRRDGSVAAQSDSGRDNVERIRVDAPNGGDFVFRVDAPAAAFGMGIKTEDFALALSRAGVTPADAPSWDMRCALPTAVAANSTFTVSCSAVNTGDLDVFRVTGSLLVPQGFSGGGPQSFGDLASGQTRTLQWTVTAPSNPGSFVANIAGTASAYGMTLDQSSALPRLEVGGAPLSLDPSVVMLSPSASGAQVRLSGNQQAALQTSANWFRVLQTAEGSLTVSLTETARNLAPGRYESQYTATVGALSARGTVVLSIPPPQPVIENARVAAGEVKMTAGCPAPRELQAVSDAIPAIYWFLVRGITAKDRITVRWIAPGGLVVETVNLPSASEASCFSASIDPKRVDAPRRLGEWRVEASINGVRQPATSFLVSPALQLSSANCPDSAAEARLLPVCLQFGDARGAGQRLHLEFVRPGGGNEQDGTAEATLTTASTQVPYRPMVPASGVWRVRVFADGALAGLAEVPVATTWTVERAEVVENRLEFSLADTLPGTKGRIDWISPSGEILQTQELDAPQASVDVPALAAQGRWRIRLFWDGILMRTIPFDRLPAQVIEQGFNSQTTLPFCAAPGRTDAAAFGALDSVARYWIRLDGVEPGARGSIEFLQAGEVRARAEFDATPSCWSAALPIAGGIGARNPGSWTVRALLSGVELSSMPLEIRRQAPVDSPRSAPLNGGIPAVALRADN